MTARRFCIALALVAACKDKPPPAPPAPPPAPEAAAPIALDDLLHFTDARIGVSSKVDNPRDFAEHVADGRLDTAWNGKTGDLVGGWIGFRVPEAARVRLIEITVGYVATSKSGEDLFAMNHRIARVRVTRGGAPLGEFALDPDSRAFQRIPLDAPGGDFKIEVLAVKPGTQAAWKELVVSELRVLGVAGAAKRDAPSIPRVVVGSLDAPPATKATSTTPVSKKENITITAGDSPAAICKAWLVPKKAEFDDIEDAGASNQYPWLPPPPACKEATLMESGGMKLLLIHRADLEADWDEPAMQQGGRTFVVDRKIDEQSHFDPHCGGTSGGKVMSARVDGATAIFRLYHWTHTNPWPSVNDDGSLGEGTPASIWRRLEELRCTTTTCEVIEIAEVRGPMDDHDDDKGPPPLPWKSE